MNTTGRDLRTLFTAGAIGTQSDGQLLERFIAAGEECAFELLLERHGPMVWGVCLRVLGDRHDAEEAFQATFLVLVRKAASVSPREQLASWLYGVSRRTALKARANSMKRRAREKQVHEIPEPEVAQDETWPELRAVLDEEVSRLPEKYRAPIVLCDLEGKGYAEAARLLGWPLGTISSRLARARDLLARRLTRRGVALSSGTLAGVLSANAASACVPTPLVFTTLRAASLFAAGQAATAGVMTANVAALVTGVTRNMLWTKVKLGTVVLSAGGLLVGSTAGLGTHAREATGAAGIRSSDPVSVVAPSANSVRPVARQTKTTGDGQPVTAEPGARAKIEGVPGARAKIDPVPGAQPKMGGRGQPKMGEPGAQPKTGEPGAQPKTGEPGAQPKMVGRGQPKMGEPGAQPKMGEPGAQPKMGGDGQTKKNIDLKE